MLENVFFTDVRQVVIDEGDTMFDKDFKEDLLKLFIPLRVSNILSIISK